MTVVSTRHGLVRGTQHGAVTRFLGLRYGASTGGSNRFLPPQPVEPWSGVLDADELGPIAPQFASSRRDPASTQPSEDCLVLNIWTPDVGERLPVVVFIHGGGFSSGYGYTSVQDGERLAAEQQVVVVSLNHRLGLLGYLHLSELGGSEWGFLPNPGILDLVAALTWVQENIESFGGDADRVLIQGHSGGGGKVATLLVSPEAAGKFSRAAIHGGPPLGLKSTAAATETARQALEKWGMATADREKLQRLPLAEIMRVQAELGVGPDPSEHSARFAPVIGTASVPAYPTEALAAGVAADVPLMVGTVVDEMRYVLDAQPAWKEPDFDLTLEEIIHLIESGVDDPRQARELVDRYMRAKDWDRNLDLLLDVLSDQFLVRTSRLADQRVVASEQPVYSYLCTMNHHLTSGAAHGIQMPLFFGNVGAGPRGFTGPEFDSASTYLMSALAEFARTGDPNPAGGAVTWPVYGIDDRRQMVIGNDGLSASSEWLDERLPLWHGVTASAATDPWGRSVEFAMSRRRVEK